VRGQTEKPGDQPGLFALCLALKARSWPRADPEDWNHCASVYPTQVSASPPAAAAEARAARARQVLDASGKKEGQREVAS